MSRRGRRVLEFVAFVLLVLPSQFAEASGLGTLVATAWQRSLEQLSADPAEYPMYTLPDGQWHTTGTDFWSSGFFPGALWIAGELTADCAWRQKAAIWTAALEIEKYQDWSQDIGFIIYTSYGNGYRLTGDLAYRDVMLTAAASLASRYSPIVGCVRASGDKDAATGDFRVIVDGMPCLELLLWGSRNGGPQAWYDMAVSHAVRTRDEFIRPDGGSYHVVQFDAATGTVNRKETHQGYSADSTWSRGQAWGIYGFTMVYRYTRDPRFLLAAQRMADYFITHLPADHVPYWDFDTPEPVPVRDSSAAAITCAGLLELSTLVKEAPIRASYWQAAEDILGSLCSPVYLSDGQVSDGILLHGTYNYNESRGVDASLIWGDYYFVEALARYSRQTSRPVLYRINCGGPILPAADGSLPPWAEDSAANPSPFLLNTTSATVFRDGAPVVLDASVPSAVPEELFRYERYDPAGEFEMEWELPATPGLDVEVRLLFAEMFAGISGPGQRVFDASIEGQTVLAGLDLFAQAGVGRGIMQAFPVTVQGDGDIDISFTHVLENPLINGIEVVSNCQVSSPSWLNESVVPMSGPLVWEFEATPMDATLNAVVALSDAAGADESDYAVLVRFNNSGQIDCFDGDAYRADVAVPYAPGQTCRFHVVANVTIQRYSACVAPAGSVWQPLIADAAFRTGPSAISFLGQWGLQSSAGRLKVCNINVSTCSGGRADFNQDCRVDQADLHHLMGCALGPGIGQNNPACAGTNLDGDATGDVDQDDFAILQRCWNKWAWEPIGSCE